MNKTLVTALLLASCGAAGASPQVSGDGACGIRAVDNESFLTCDGDRAPPPAAPAEFVDYAGGLPAIAIDAKRAWQIKHDLGAQVLLVDIRGRAEVFYTGMPLGADAIVPFEEPSRDFAIDAQSGRLAMEFNAHFLERMDDLLNASDLSRSDPVVLLCRSGERSRQAAALLKEHGYRQVFVVSDGFEGALTASAEGGEARRERGWKNAGLPWTARVDPRWLQSGTR